MRVYRPKKQKRKYQLAFTLIELLVVIAIVGLLASIVIVGIRRTIIRAKNTTTVSNLRTFHQWQEIYLDEHHDYLPDDCPGSIDCHICRQRSYPSWNWPPASLGSETDPFQNGLPSLHTYNGCMSYYHSDGSPLGYELWFHMYFENMERLRETNRTFQSIFSATKTPGYSLDPDGYPCEWLGDDVVYCIIQYYAH